jgi:hypothetical protein
LIDEGGDPVLSFTAPFDSLNPSDPDAVERRCMESYTRAVLRVDPTYFDTDANVETFEALTGGTLPDEETVDRLRDEVMETAAARA